MIRCKNQTTGFDHFCSFKLNSNLREIIDKVQESNNTIIMMKCINYDSLISANDPTSGG